MQFSVVSRDRIAAEWPVFAEVLAPAVRQDPRQTLEGLRNRIAAGADWLLEVSGDARGLMVLEVSSELFCWVKYVGGRIDGGPKQRARAIIAAVQHIETVARAAGCTEIRLCGRDWSALLTGFEPFEGFRNGLKKELT